MLILLGAILLYYRCVSVWNKKDSEQRYAFQTYFWQANSKIYALLYVVIPL